MMMRVRKAHRKKLGDCRLPSENIIMVNNPERHADKSEYHFHVPIDMSKPEIKDYLTKVYDLDVVKVNTANYDGKTKYRGGSRQPLKGKRYKKAFVTLASDSGPEPAVVVASKPKPKPKPAGVAKKQQ